MSDVPSKIDSPKTIGDIWPKEKIELIKRTVAKGATNDELSLFLYQAHKTGLDPLTRQIYFIKGNDGRVMMQTSIDGFRLVAQRSDEYAGQDAPVFVEDGNGGLVSCSINVYKFRGNIRYQAAVGVAFFKEYNKPGMNGRLSMWDKMPRVMLSKVAEAIALRKAFPQDLSSIYTADEVAEDSMIVQPEEVKTYTEPVKKDITGPIGDTTPPSGQNGDDGEVGTKFEQKVNLVPASEKQVALIQRLMKQKRGQEWFDPKITKTDAHNLIDELLAEVAPDNMNQDEPINVDDIPF